MWAGYLPVPMASLIIRLRETWTLASQGDSGIGRTGGTFGLGGGRTEQVSESCNGSERLRRGFWKVSPDDHGLSISVLGSQTMDNGQWRVGGRERVTRHGTCLAVLCDWWASEGAEGLVAATSRAWTDRV